MSMCAVTNTISQIETGVGECTYAFIRFFPIGKASISLYYFDACPGFGESTDGKFVCQFSTLFVELWSEELAPSHDEGGEEEWAFAANISDGMQSRVEQVDIRVQAQEEQVKEDLDLVLIDDAGSNGVTEAVGSRINGTRGWYGERVATV